MVFARGIDEAGMAVKQPRPLARVLGTYNLARAVIDERISPVTDQSPFHHVRGSQLFSHH